jgi:hypothetical protein
MTDPKWNKQPPALGEILIKLASLNARLMRMEAVKRLQALAKIKALAEKQKL